MCTIMTVSRKLFDDNENVITDRIVGDYKNNDDGFALLLWSEEYKSFTQLRGFDAMALLSVLQDGSWDRMWLHQRMATQGAATLDNCHGWSASGTYIMHNGILSDPRSKKLPVDSMLIGHWMKELDLGGATNNLLNESFANVLLIDKDGYRVIASTFGQLHTDGNGNFSTVEVDGLIEGKISGPDYNDYRLDGTNYRDDEFQIELPYSWRDALPAWYDKHPSVEVDVSLYTEEELEAYYLRDETEDMLTMEEFLDNRKYGAI